MTWDQINIWTNKNILEKKYKLSSASSSNLGILDQLRTLGPVYKPVKRTRYFNEIENLIIEYVLHEMWTNVHYQIFVSVDD